MKKDKEWLKEEVMNLYPSHNEMYEHPDYITVAKVDLINDFIELIDQLDEPETLSQKWIDDNKVARVNDLRKMTTSDVVTVVKLKNLLVPKQDDGFVVFEKDKLDEEVQRMIDETYKAMSEKPEIPQFVADYYNDYKDHELTFAEWFECAELGKGGKTENKTFEWLLDNTHEVNIERQFILADIIAHGLDGYEVEKEKVYIIKFAPSIYGTPTYGSIGTQSGKKIMQSIYGSPGVVVTPNQYTEEEIKEVGSKYMAFAEEVVE